MKQILLIFTTALFLISCTQNPNPAFDKNVELAKTWFSAFEAEDMETISGMFAEEVEYQGAFYGMELMTTKAGVGNQTMLSVTTRIKFDTI